MKCSKCGNTKDFIIFGNQNLIAGFENGYLREVKKEDFNISDIYPVICKKCQSEDVDFQYTELKEIFNRIK